MTSSFRFVCELPTGLHARPASLLSETVRRFHAAASVTNEKTGASADARSVLSVIGLDVERGHTVLVEAIGDDAAALLEAVRVLATGHFGESLDGSGEAAGMAKEFVVRIPEPLRRLGVVVVTGRPVCAGVGEGVALIAGGLHIPEGLMKVKGESPEAERKRVGDAIATVRVEIEQSLKRAKGLEAELLRAHLGIVDDPALRHRIDALAGKGQSAVCATSTVCREFAAKLGASTSAYIRERAADVEEVCRRILSKIDPGALAEKPIELKGPSVLVAQTLGVGQLMGLDRKNLKGLVLGEVGGTSHLVILARSLRIPTLINVEAGVSGKVRAGESVVVDAVGGFVVTQATEGVQDYYRRDARARDRRRTRLEPLLRKLGSTRDGRGVEVAANANGPEEIAAAMEAGADSIGLLRTELLFLDRAEAPSEEEQFELYRGAVEAANSQGRTGCPQSGTSGGTVSREVIIRALDIGGDKPAPYLDLPKEENPFLGCRGIRLYHKFPELMRAQLRAICRASAFGKIKVMAPMVATVTEAKWFRDQVRHVQEDLKAEGVAHDPKMPVGIMVEVPSVATIVDQIARVVDFVSIGTNDLCQYWMAADRGNRDVAAMNNPRQPSFLRLLQQIVSAARKHGCWVGVCGEMAGDAANLPLMVGLGVNEISMSAPSVGPIKSRLAALAAGECRDVLEKAMACETPEQVDEVLKEFGAVSAGVTGVRPLHRDLVMIDLDVVSKEQAIQEMVGALHVAGRTDEPRTVEAAIWAREQTYATGLGYGFAIPHCRSDAVACPSITVAKLRTPIEWGSTDGAPVSIALMLTVRESDADQTHLKLLAKLARRLMHEGFRENLMQAGDAEAVLNVLQTELELPPG